MHRISASPPRRRIYARRLALRAALAGVLAPLLFWSSGSAVAAPPTPPGAADARTLLASLTVKAEGPLTGYSRTKFPPWITQTGACDTREVVLHRDGTNVVTDRNCHPTSGTWRSPYDGATWHAAADVDIDHVVPLAEAWRSGASGWTTARRQQFANELSIAQLVAVTDNVNQAKGDKDPAQWMPPLAGYRCTYDRMWVWVKHTYGLSVDPAEKSALTATLRSC
jgi:hypothetical protein